MDLYKLYNNGLVNPAWDVTLVRYRVVPGCADDATILKENKRALQLLVDKAVDYSVLETFLLQPIKRL